MNLFQKKNHFDNRRTLNFVPSESSMRLKWECWRLLNIRGEEVKSFIQNKYLIVEDEVVSGGSVVTCLIF